MAFKYLHLILAEKFKINIYLFITIILIIAGTSYYLFSEPECKICEVCEICKVCDTCVACPTCEKEVCPECEPDIQYMCPSGEVVEINEECDILSIPEGLEYTSIYNDTYRGISFFLNTVEYEEGDNYNSIRKIKYTITNAGDYPILPKIYVRLFESNVEATSDTSHRQFELNDFLMKGDWIQKEEAVDMTFIDTNYTIALDLYDTSQDPDVGVLTLEMPMKNADIR